jgi:hypothetical protein
MLEAADDGALAAEPRDADVQAARVDGANRRRRPGNDQGREEQREAQAPVHAGKYDMALEPPRFTVIWGKC